MPKKAKWLVAVSMIVLLCLILSRPRNHFYLIFSCYTLFFIGYLLILRKEKQLNKLSFWIVLAVILRIIAVFFFPNLSDDIYRFIWDGNLLNQGINPFKFLPSYYVDPENIGELTYKNIEIDSNLYDRLNSPNYFSVYPPASQFSFWLSSFFCGSSWYAQAVFLKILLLLSEIGTLALIWRILKHYSMPSSLLLVYALNPLVIIEICGNIHFEGMMIFFFLWAYWSLIRKKNVQAGILYSFSFLSKLVSALPSIFLLKRLSNKALLLIITAGLITTIIGFLPLINTSFTENFGESLNLYFQKFEFNAGLYYLAKWIGYQIKGFNMISLIGPLMAGIGLVIILISFLVEKNKQLTSFPQMVVLSMTVYYLFSTTVHPWYITTLIAFSTFTKFKFPIVWSFFIFMTYINYSYDSYFENLWIVALEYILLISFLIYELVYKKSP